MYDFEEALKDYKNGNEEKLRKMIVPAEEAITKVLPSVQANGKNIKPLLTGKPLMKHDIAGKLPEKEIFAVFNEHKFIAVMKKSEEGDIIARPEFVFN